MTTTDPDSLALAPLSDERIANLYSWATAWRAPDDVGDAERPDLVEMRDKLAAEFALWRETHDRNARSALMLEFFERFRATGSVSVEVIRKWWHDKIAGTETLGPDES